MKRTSLLITLLLLLACAVRAQPYFPLSLKSINYFGGTLYKEINYALAPLDSLVGQQPKQYTFAPTILTNLSFKYTHQCIANGLNSILGTQVKNYGDTLFEFSNFINKPTKVYLNTAVGSSWIAYEDSNVIATFTHDSTTIYTINGITDTLQIIGITLDSLSGSFISSNYKPIVIGLKIGLIQFPMFYAFPYALDKYQSVSPIEFKKSPTHIHNITWDSIYKFDVGDEFHVFYSRYTHDMFNVNSLKTDTSKTVYEILQRIQPNPDSLCYLTKRISFHSTFKNTIYNHEFISDTIYLGYKRLLHLDTEPALFVKSPENANVIAYDTNGLLKLNHIRGPLYGNDSCISYMIDAQGAIEKRYYNGLGGPYFDNYFEENGYTNFERNQLVFYRKGNKTFGIPIPKTVGLTELTKQPLATIFPNPAKQFITIKLTKHNQATVVCLYDKLGKTILTQHTTEPQITLSIDTLPKGIYFYTVTQHADVSSGKIVIE
jgi:hypothetical protein